MTDWAIATGGLLVIAMGDCSRSDPDTESIFSQCDRSRLPHVAATQMATAQFTELEGFQLNKFKT